MNLYALLTLCATEISFLLGLSVYLLNRKSGVNRLFMVAMFANGYWALCTFMKAQAGSVADALLWTKALAFWPFLPALMLHFALVFTENTLIKKKLTYMLLYLPPLVFSLATLTTDWMGTVELTPWGYVTVLSTNSISLTMGSIWAIASGLMAILLYLNYYRRVDDKTRKNQTKFVAIGFGVPTILAVLTDSLFPAMQISLPGLGSISGSITSLFVIYGMIRHDLFVFKPEIAAENIFSTMPDSVILLNLKGDIVKVNRALTELTGYTESEMVGKSIYDIMRQSKLVDKSDASPRILNQLRSCREIRNYEIRFLTKAGEQKHCALSCSIVVDSHGKDVGAAFILHDLTERLELEQKILRSERLASIGELAGMLGHDLRNPLSGISGASYYLKRKHLSRLDSEDLSMFESIDKCISYSNKIINDLLDYSKEIRLELDPTNPHALIVETLTLIQHPPHITVKNLAQDTPRIIVDRVKICRSFTNIIKNAFDAMPSSGELTITSQVIDEAVIFCFKDTGQGMTAQTIEKLWSPLFTTKAKGMGFGLAICKRNVEAHGGKIAVESKLGEGTVMQVQLPLDCKN
ncbi:MAG: PAS domain S-box protein [Candidatus Bathyarchaeota archaeon]|nr:PAS domain S-box protein [Candidatus Bathyarchaeota archaeon]